MSYANIAFLVGGALWLVPSLILGVWMTRAQRRYIDQYRSVNGVNRVPSADDSWTVMSDPFVGKRWWDIVWEKQSVPELEHARREVVWRFKVCAVYVFGGSLIPFMLGVIFCA